MKIIHCADIHIDSSLNTHLSMLQSQKRKNEILEAFSDMADYAGEHGVSVILICGDMFDSPYISRTAADIVSGVIKNHEHIDFIYLSGNHDEGSFMERISSLNNLKIIDSSKTYGYGNIEISAFTNKLKNMDRDKVNIVMMHGMIKDINKFAERNIDYLALGHIHKYTEGNIDSRGIYCYCGCLEPRGFDECGRKGFVELEVDDQGIVSRNFVDFASRTAYSCLVDVSACESMSDVCRVIDETIDNNNYGRDDMVEITIIGNYEAENGIDISYISNRYQKRFFAFKVKNDVTIGYKIDKISREQSLRGEFVRKVLESDKTDGQKRDIIECGLQALNGGSL